jgi:hypothetical protein
MGEIKGTLDLREVFYKFLTLFIFIIIKYFPNQFKIGQWFREIEIFLPFYCLTGFIGTID